MTAFDLEAEVRDLAARRDIANLACDYAHSLDRTLPDQTRGVFHDDGYVDCGIFVGNAHDFAAAAQGFLATLESTQHLLGQMRIRIDGKVAYGEIYFTAFHRMVADGQETDLVIGGRYVDQYEDRGHGWKIAKRRILTDWSRTEPAADSFAKDSPPLFRGKRASADFSENRDWPKA